MDINDLIRSLPETQQSALVTMLNNYKVVYVKRSKTDGHIQARFEVRGKIAAQMVLHPAPSNLIYIGCSNGKRFNGQRPAFSIPAEMTIALVEKLAARLEKTGIRYVDVDL